MAQKWLKEFFIMALKVGFLDFIFLTMIFYVIFAFQTPGITDANGWPVGSFVRKVDLNQLQG